MRFAEDWEGSLERRWSVRDSDIAYLCLTLPPLFGIWQMVSFVAYGPGRHLGGSNAALTVAAFYLMFLGPIVGAGIAVFNSWNRPLVILGCISLAAFGGIFMAQFMSPAIKSSPLGVGFAAVFGSTVVLYPLIAVGLTIRWFAFARGRRPQRPGIGEPPLTSEWKNE